MLAHQRQSIILDELERLGTVRVRAMALLLGVSEMTVRRDLEQLASEDQLEKVHGGAARLDGRSTNEPGFAAKSALQQSEKYAIARAAAELVEPGSAIAVTGGTTTFLLAEFFQTIPDLTIITNSLTLADAMHLGKDPTVTVVLTGGTRTKSDALVGPVADSTLRSISVDTLFMGVHGMSDESGFSAPTLAETETNRAFIKTTSELVVLADHTKWNIRGLGTIAGLHDADIVISDSQLPNDAATALRTAGTELRLVNPDPPTKLSVAI